MPFLLLLLLSVACLPVGWQAPPDQIGPTGSIVLTWLGVALIVASAFAIARRMCRLLGQSQVERGDLLTRYARWRIYHLIALIVVYGLALYVIGWGWAVQMLCVWGPPDPDGTPVTLPGTELLILAPLVVSLALSWACFYDAERALHDARCSWSRSPYWTRSAYVLFHLRQHLALVFVPLLLLIVIRGASRSLPTSEDSEYVTGGLTLALSLIVFGLMPWVLRGVLGLKPMPESALRYRLESTARRLRFRCNDILLWNTQGGVANAMVVGILPFLRYVVLTDRLVAEMTPDEVEAVFGHEVGHIKHHHMPYYLGFLICSLAALISVWTGLAPERRFGIEIQQQLAALPLVALLFGYIFVVFGFLSRRCERQADLYGCLTVSCGRDECAGHDIAPGLTVGAPSLCPTGIHTFISALERVATLNGISRERPGWLQSWQHSTIARRVEFLQRVLVDRTVESRFQRAVTMVRWLLFVGLAVVLASAGWTWGWDKLFPR